ESGRREHKQIMVLNVTGITQLVRDVARGNEGITGLQNKDLISNGDFQFSGQDVVNLILTRMRMTRHTQTRRQAYLQQAVLSSCIDPPQAYRTNAHVEVNNDCLAADTSRLERGGLHRSSARAY